MGTASHSSESQEPPGGCIGCNTCIPGDFSDMLLENTCFTHTHTLTSRSTHMSRVTYSLLIARPEWPEAPGNDELRVFDRVRALEGALQPDVRAVHRLHSTRGIHSHGSHAVPSCNTR